MDGSLFDRGRALEDNFFREKDRQLLEQLRRELSNKQERAALASASGIEEEAVLNALVENHVTAESLSSLSIVPLVAVAWADGRLEPTERDAILRATESVGIDHDGISYKLIESWLQNEPPADLLNSWELYVSELKNNMDDESFHQLGKTVVGRAREIAAASGGILGFGKTSGSEARLIERLQNAFK